MEARHHERTHRLTARSPFRINVGRLLVYGYDMPDDLGGGFVTGELLLRADGVLLRRQTLYFPTGGGKLSPGFGPWEQVTWWEGEADSERAARVLHYRGYDLHKLDPASMSKPGDDLGTGS